MFAKMHESQRPEHQPRSLLAVKIDNRNKDADMDKVKLRAFDTKPESGGIIDVQILAQLIDDIGKENAEAVLDAFVDELEKQTQILLTAVHDKNPDAIAQAAHRLKGTTASIGANAVNHAVVSLEQAAKAARIETIDETIGEFQNLAHQTLREMAFIRQGLLAG